MNTPTHCLINWTVAKSLPGKNFPKSAVLLGSIAPDIPLYFLSLTGTVWFRFVQGWEWPQVGKHMYGSLFYHDPIWISLHNLLHSPLVLLAGLACLRVFLSKDRFRASWFSWFLASCLLHTMVDIPVHHDDGPLVLWPLNWSYRFASPISYWDPKHFGHPTMVAEGILFTLLLGYLIWSRAKQTRQGNDVN